MESVQQKARRQQRVEELCAATARALTGEPDLHYRAGRLRLGEQPVPVHAPHLRLDPDWHDLQAHRGMIDSVALRLCHSDPALHHSRAPTDPISRLIFELLEQLRVETYAPETMPGMKRNLRQRFEQWLRDFHGAGMTETDVGVLLFTVAQIFRARLTGQPVLEETEGVIEATRAAVAPLLGPHLAGLRRTRGDQAAFADHALALGELISGLIGQAGGEGDEETNEDNDALAAFALLLDFDLQGEEPLDGGGASGGRSPDDGVERYQVYSRRYDRETEIGKLVRRDLLAQYRRQLDALVAAQGVNTRRLVRQLAALFAVPQRDGWSFGEEQGYIDGRRLGQLVSSPDEHRVFRLEREKPVGNAVVSILIDCSGSMKEHMESVAALVDILVRALEQAQAKTEVLGFTTGGWNGGRVWQEWLARGRPEAPGRLTEVTHLVFKSAGQNWRRSRRDIAGLFKQDLFREGVDGEAVEWACRRLLTHDEDQRVLLVISDGCPMERATALANHEHYLDNHLRDVVSRYDARPDLNILGLGVGLDLGAYYRQSLATDLTRGLDNQLLFDIVQLMAGRHRR